MAFRMFILALVLLLTTCLAAPLIKPDPMIAAIKATIKGQGMASPVGHVVQQRAIGAAPGSGTSVRQTRQAEAAQSCNECRRNGSNCPSSCNRRACLFRFFDIFC